MAALLEPAGSFKTNFMSDSTASQLTAIILVLGVIGSYAGIISIIKKNKL